MRLLMPLACEGERQVVDRFLGWNTATRVMALHRYLDCCAADAPAHRLSLSCSRFEIRTFFFSASPVGSVSSRYEMVKKGREECRANTLIESSQWESYMGEKKQRQIVEWEIFQHPAESQKPLETV